MVTRTHQIQTWVSVAILAAMLNPPANAQKMTMSSTGTVTKGANKVPGARVALFGQTGGGLFFRASGKSNAMGVYPQVDLPVYTPAVAGGKVWWGIVGKLITVNGRLVNWDYGVDSGLLAHPGANMNLAVDKDINLNIAGGGVLPAWLNAGQWAWLVNDPTYDYVATGPYEGTISLDNAFFPGVHDINVMGMVQYRDGTRTTGNDVNESGSSLSESVFNYHFEIDDIQVSGLDANGKPILQGGGVQLKSDLGTLLMSASLSGLIADNSTADPVFEGYLGNVQFTSASQDSTLLTQWAEELALGKEFRIGLDPAILSATSGFATSATVSGFLATATVPEPSSWVFVGVGVAMLVAAKRQRGA